MHRFAILTSAIVFFVAIGLAQQPSAGGPYRLPGDYVYSNQRLPYSQSGQWGYVRVLPSGDTRLLPLAGAGAGTKSASVEQPAQVIPVAAK